MNEQAVTDSKRWVVRGTASRKGRHLSVSPKDGVMDRLYYGRIVLDREVPSVTFETGSREVGLICIAGSCVVAVGSNEHALARHDAVYVPRGSTVEVQTTSAVDLVECAAEVSGDYP